MNPPIQRLVVYMISFRMRLGDIFLRTFQVQLFICYSDGIIDGGMAFLSPIV